MRLDFFQDAGQIILPAQQPVIQARVSGRSTANRSGSCPDFIGVCFNAAEGVVKFVHGGEFAKRHDPLQVPIDTLPDFPPPRLTSAMAEDFRAALLWHMQEHGTTVAQLVAATGVTRDIINKVRMRENASTSVENAVLIAAYYGKTVNEFLALRPSTEASRIRALVDLLPTEAQRLLEAQIRGLLDHREQKEV